MSMDRIIREEARLIILRALRDEPDQRLNSELLRRSLEQWGITRSRDWVQGEIRHLEEIGAVTVAAAGSVLVASLSRRGEDHVERCVVLDGVKRPSAPEL